MNENKEKILLEHLYSAEKLTLEECMKLLGVSESTVRRTFSKLEKDGIAIRTHGGIRYITSAITSYSFEKGAHTNIDKKTAIARTACKLIENGDVIFCDSGTTIRCFCSELALHLKKENINVKFYTNSIANVEILSPYTEVHLIGGKYRINRKDFCGYIAEQTLNRLYFTKSFVGADGCIDASQFTTTDFETARINEIVIQNSSKAFMLIDSSKFNSASHIIYTSANRLEAVVTDRMIPEEEKQLLIKQGCRVICSNSGTDNNI
ncbi:MAG: DeoR/GlpR family DNA-binding transcription regulator [Clostridia bacterium]|nr:DeoR/GlpR family DNA-binding transcription regulator [Clostridia bacterium]